MAAFLCLTQFHLTSRNFFFWDAPKTSFLRCVPSNNNLKQRLVSWNWWKFASACPGSKDMRWKFLRPNPVRWSQLRVHLDDEKTASNENGMSLFISQSRQSEVSRKVARDLQKASYKEHRESSSHHNRTKIYHIKRIGTNISFLHRPWNKALY